MRRTLLTITAAVLFVAALAGWAWFLYRRHNLAEADQLSSVIGLFVNTPLTVLSLVLGWLGWRAGTSTDRRSATGTGPSPDRPNDADGTTHNNTFTANDQATQYNAPGGSMTFNNGGEHRR